jgi:RNA polymerase sigma-70 factor, ECF subfamily
LARLIIGNFEGPNGNLTVVSGTADGAHAVRGRVKGEPTRSDSELVACARAGEREAFEAMYQRYHAGIYQFARAMTGSTSLAEDITQEVFLALIRGLDGYDDTRGALNTYLYAIARNVSRHRLRRERRFVGLELWTRMDPGTNEDPLQPVMQVQTVARVRAFIRALSARYREVLILCDLQGLSYEEAATVLNIRIGTVRSRLHRARQQLAARMTHADLLCAPVGERARKCLI